ncbi:RNA methyltransferase [Dyadobacter fermentans]|uniref:tRNA/rRNA methyltransferase (SpoU) n=1 Tax=Dyadobacter fermentans (strain ATCC 700827 / DSM 18053 / CIP 107007 / KCTC 52180 / NS114) TaxID=471854 RepID=C6W5Q9_DYAFD|nr:RNA methyltransferase [Dyadobacter fermentans]ACT95998.1 tRNA/rRNA methyltransferase (SpoU) [Dyadobacter fermentans DSM 18053]
MRKLSVDEMGRMSVDEFRESEKFPLVIVLDNIRSLNNIGSFFRTADAFRAEKIVLCGYTQQPPHREITRSALGAEMAVAWEKNPSAVDAVNALKSQGYNVWCVEQAEGSVLLQDFEPAAGDPYAFVFGNEVEGVADEVIAASDGCLEIPQFGTKHSFNVSVSAGIVLWDYIRKKITEK